MATNVLPILDSSSSPPQVVRSPHALVHYAAFVPPQLTLSLHPPPPPRLPYSPPPFLLPPVTQNGTSSADQTTHPASSSDPPKFVANRKKSAVNFDVGPIQVIAESRDGSGSSTADGAAPLPDRAVRPSGSPAGPSALKPSSYAPAAVAANNPAISPKSTHPGIIITQTSSGGDKESAGGARSPRGTRKRGSLADNTDSARADIAKELSKGVSPSSSSSPVPAVVSSSPKPPFIASPLLSPPAAKSPQQRANFLTRAFSTRSNDVVPPTDADAPADTSKSMPKVKAASARGFFSPAGDSLGKLFSSSGKNVGASFRGMGLGGGGGVGVGSPLNNTAVVGIGGDSADVGGSENPNTPLTRTKHNALLHANFEAIEDVDEDLFDGELTTISLRAPCLHGGQGGEVDDMTAEKGDDEEGDDEAAPLSEAISARVTSGRIAAAGKKRRVSSHDTKVMFKKAYEKLCRENKTANNGGKISLEKGALRQLFHNLDDQSFEDVYTLFDWDNDGSVDLKEFIYTMTLILTKPPDDDEDIAVENSPQSPDKSGKPATSAVDLLFNIFDLDSSGTMDAQEFSRMMRTILRCRLTRVDFVLKTEVRRGVFRKMIEKEFAEESLDFWERVSQWRANNVAVRGHDTDTSLNRRASLGFAKGQHSAHGGHNGAKHHGAPMQKKDVVESNLEAQEIYVKHVAQSSSGEVNIPGKMRKAVKALLDDNKKDGGNGDGDGMGTPPLLDSTLFDDCQSEIYHLLNRDTFSRFKEDATLSANLLLLLFAEVDVVKKGSIGIQEYRAWAKINPEIMQFWRDLHAQTTAGVVKAATAK